MLPLPIPQQRDKKGQFLFEEKMIEIRAKLDRSQALHNAETARHAREIQLAVNKAMQHALNVGVFPPASRILRASTPPLELFRLGLRHYRPGETSEREIVVDPNGNLFSMSRVGDYSPGALEIILGNDDWVKFGLEAFREIERLTSVAHTVRSSRTNGLPI